MNVIIPLGGKGTRFSEETLPKPLVHYLGEPMIFRIIEGINIDENDKIFIPYEASLEAYNFENMLYKRFPNLKIRFKKVSNQKGAAHTLYEILGEFTDKELDDVTISLDGDTYYNEDIVKLCKADNDSAIFYFKDFQEKPIFSYIKLDENNRIIMIKEKVKISDNANSGCYKFSSGRLLKKYCERILMSNIPNELYTSKVYDLMIQDGYKIFGHEIKRENIICIGTPSQLREQAIRQPSSQKIFCFDLDNTLVSFPHVSGDYSTVKPIEKNVDFLRNLKKKGHKIIIYSSRRMLTHGGDVKKVIDDIGEATIKQLKEFDIPYDEIIFGKPYAHFYIDDLSINPLDSNLERRTGFHFASFNGEVRKFNRLEVGKDSIKKISEDSSISGEIYYYRNIPDEIKRFFPKFITTDEKSYYEIERIYGLNFSDLYTNDLLTFNDLKNLFGVLREIHSIKRGDDIDIYENYAEKIKKRAEKYDYSRFEKNAEIYEFLMKNLEIYKMKNLGIKAVIHGDPTFTNVLISKSFGDVIKFVDMRGIQGDKFSIEGDIFYDYAKIYHSILGYDYVIKGMPINYKNIEKFKLFFDEEFVSLYGSERLKYLKILTLSLFYSLIPLHEEKDPSLFWDLTRKLYDEIKDSK
ncbi:MAG TPA: sugar phosphate nucleotidyltransferase [Candidatus Omnitrophota bacterium]|nr:sugar phosphate nucleotidyltransferase [Candidatus Omnitrophota bacterium]